MSSFLSKVSKMGSKVEGNSIDVTPRNEDLLAMFDREAKTSLSRAQMLYDAAFPMGHQKDSEGNHYRMAYKSSSGGVCVKFKPE